MRSEDIVRWLLLAAAGSIAVSGMEITYEQHAKFPKLYHLDDYYDCLGPADGLYCVGTFHIRPLKDRDPVYELMEEYSQDNHNFNRTLIHRGFCVSSRCPSLSHVRNASLRFERCAAKYAKRRSLRTVLQELSYCRTHAQEYALKDISASVETPHLVFVCVVLVVLALNVIGTTYDVMKGEDKKNSLLTSWSMVSNWPQLVGPYPSGDPRLTALLPVEAGRVIFILLVIFVHSGCVHSVLYLANSKFVEEMSHHWVMMFLQNGSSTIQIFIVASNFFLANALLRMKQPNFRMLTNIIIKRIFRIVPVYLLGISFAATWWPLMREGPLWESTVGAESHMCRRKFWSHVFFLHNFFEPDQHCLVQTWFLAVDMQLYIVGAIITVCLARVKKLALPILGTAFVASVILTYCLAYIYEWKALLFVSGPESIRNMFRYERSFHEFYTHPLGSVPSMLVGLFVAHLNHQLTNTGFNIADHKYIFYGFKILIPMLAIWNVSGHFVRNFDTREFSALYMALERPISMLMSGALLFGAYNGSTKKEIKKITRPKNIKGSTRPNMVKGFLTNTFSWPIWYPMGRSSLSVLMLHWCVNMLIKAPTLQPITSTTLEMVADTLSTTCLTYMAAIPITLLVEIPFTKLYSSLTSQEEKKVD